MAEAQGQDSLNCEAVVYVVGKHLICLCACACRVCVCVLVSMRACERVCEWMCK